MKSSKAKGLVLVTGGAGFIGSHLVDGLIGAGYGVRVLDSLKPPTHNGKVPEWFNNKAELIKGDVRDRKTLGKALKGVDYIFHLAAYMDFLPDFSTYFTTNTASTALIYEIIVEKKLPVKKIIITSSQSVYGEGKYLCATHGEMYLRHRAEEQLRKKDWEMHCPQDGSIVKPVAENEDDILSPQIPYGISKLAAEKVAVILGKIYNIPTVAVRYSIVHGIRQSFRHFYSGALRSFAVQALSGKPLTIHEDGKQIRDFVNIKDVTAAHLLLLEDPRADYEAFNIGSGQITTVLDVAKLVAKEAGIKFQPTTTGEYRLNTPRHQIMNIDKLKKLGWKPKYTLANNVKEYVQWVSSYPEAIKYFQLSDKILKKAKIIK